MFLTGCNNGVWGRNLPGEERGNHIRATRTIMQLLGAAIEKKVLSAGKF